MSHRPRWLDQLAVGTVAVLLTACGQAAAPTVAPTAPASSAPTTAATQSATAGTTQAASASPSESAAASPSGSAGASASASAGASPSASAGASPSESAGASPSESAGATPAGTPYPDPAAKPAAPAAGITSYPDYGEVDCAAGTFNGLPYSGNLKKITAPDDKTVVFSFCNPDVAFLSQIAFAALGIDDAGYLIKNMPTALTGEGSALPEGSLLTTPNGTGPYKLKSWDRGNRMDFEANPDYWGDKPKTPNLEFRWQDQSAARLVDLTSGQVDGIDNPGKDDLPAITGDSSLAFYPRTGLNTFYLGMNNTYKPWDKVKVRQAIAMGIDRKQIVDKYYPPGSEVATFFTPCAIPNSCEGKDYYKFDPVAAKALLADAGFPDGFETKIQYRAAVRGYLPDPPTIAQEIQSQLKTNLNITATPELQDSGTFLDNNAAGKLDGLFMLGWGADFPDTSNFMDYHFGAGTGDKFGTVSKALIDAVVAGGRTAKDADRAAAYGKANDLVREEVPAVFVAHGGSGTAFKKDVAGGYASPLIENFNIMKAADRDTIVFEQNAEPISLYCGDESDGETLRACQQIKESLYQYGGDTGLDPVPALATKCSPNTDLTEWTCNLREGVKFHDGAAFGADDVILSFAAQWDTLSPLHIGRTGSFEYWGALIGQGYLNPSAPCGLPNSSPCQ